MARLLHGMRQGTALVFLCAVVLSAALHGQDAEDAAIRTDDFSLELDATRASPGYFPLGVVRGDAALSVAAGFNQAQEAVQAPEFAAGAPYPAPSPWQQDAGNLRYFSLALAADSLTRERDRLDLFDPALPAYLENYARAHVQSRVQSPLAPRIHLWGLDNEWEPPLPASAAARGQFLEWLRRAYADDIAGLNEAWSTQYAAFDATVVAEAPAADSYRRRPGAFLDWHAFATEHFLHLLVTQARVMRDADPQTRGVVHKATQLTLDRPTTSRARLFDHGRFAELIRPYSGGFLGVDMYGAGDRQAYETSYLYHSIRPLDRAPGYGVLLTETNNHNGPAQQFASTYWRLLANGMKGAMFFTQGNLAAPAGSDWNYYGMREPDTGRFTPRWFQAARFAAAVHRSEAFWTRAVPAPDLPRIAMLQPHRDVLLAESSRRDRSEGRFAYARNERWRVYRWLREQGYWVDVLPYAKLDDAYLKAYDALVLIGAEHLSRDESATLVSYAKRGGVIVSDTVPGYFDEHHRVRNEFAMAAGIPVERGVRERHVRLEIGGAAFSSVTTYEIAPGDAQVIARDVAGAPRALLQSLGSGRTLWLPFELGALRGERDESGESLISRWFAGLLAAANVLPAYASGYGASAGMLRVEQPYMDAAGNVALVVATRAQEEQEHLPAGSVELPLPGGPWQQGWWASAGSDALVPVAISACGGQRHRIELPAIDTAGILYLFRKHPPLLGFGADGMPARVQPGTSFTLPVQLVNPGAEPLAPGALRVQVPPGWSVLPDRVATPALRTGAMHKVRFTVTPPASGLQFMPGRPYPVLAHWNDGAGVKATLSTLVEADGDDADRALLLTGNASYAKDFRYRLDTGATYRHLLPAPEAIADPARALVNGFGGSGGERDSFNRGGYVRAHYVRYEAEVAEILFDLQASRQIERIHVVKGPERVTPLSVETYTSDDGAEYSRRGAVQNRVPEAAQLEDVIELPRIRARYVKLRVVWPAPGGTLDEIEVWGR